MSAIRLARGYTGRNTIIKFEGCYHGHSDALLVKAGSGLVTFGNTSSAGVPASFVNETIVLPLDSEEALDQAFRQFGQEIACVIIEPVPANNGLLMQRPEFLRHLKNVCTANGALLIFDEVINGFRIGFEGAAAYYDIAPDIITYGKIIGGGLPVGMYGASAKIMASISPEGDVYQAGTLSGNPVAMAAGIATLKQCLVPGFYSGLEKKTTMMLDLIRNGINRDDVQLFQIGSIFWIAFSTRQTFRSAEDIDGGSMQHFRTLHAQLLENGVYLGPSGYEVGFVSAAHSTQDLEKTAELFVRFLKK
jgi:glutamate-1-semialdehyde 2,1-aminomutase